MSLGLPQSLWEWPRERETMPSFKSRVYLEFVICRLTQRNVTEKFGNFPEMLRCNMFYYMEEVFLH